MMNKRWAALVVAVMCVGTAGAAAPVVVDTSGLLTVQDRQVLDSIVEHYAVGTRPLAERMDDAEDAMEDYLERQYGDDVYDVDTQLSRGSDAQVTLVVSRRAMQVDPRRFTDGQRVADRTGRLTAADRSEIEKILAAVTARGGDADAAEDAVERYLEGRYGHDVYDTDVVRDAEGYRVMITAD